jgi:rhodanese-related sulfurtransferase
MKYITTETCQALLANGQVQLIDIREPWEVEICSVGATCIPMHEAATVLAKLDPAQSYVIMCKTGRRAEAVANLLQSEYQFKDVAVLEGGITAWFEKTEPTFEMY